MKGFSKFYMSDSVYSLILRLNSCITLVIFSYNTFLITFWVTLIVKEINGTIISGLSKKSPNASKIMSLTNNSHLFLNSEGNSKFDDVLLKLSLLKEFVLINWFSSSWSFQANLRFSSKSFSWISSVMDVLFED